jgi:hypothetical protein
LLLAMTGMADAKQKRPGRPGRQTADKVLAIGGDF